MNASLYQQYVQAKAEHPGKYARDLATLMGISEAELTHSRVGHDANVYKVMLVHYWPHWNPSAKSKPLPATPMQFMSKWAAMRTNT